MSRSCQCPQVCSATPWEVACVANLIASEARSTYLEIGSHAGGSLLHYGSAMYPGSTLIAIDLCGHADAERSLRIVTEGLVAEGYGCHLIVGDSRSPAVVARVTEIVAPLSGIDVLLIDGGHAVETAESDLATYLPLVREGGVVIMHDVGEPHPAKEVTPKVADVLTGLNSLWQRVSRGRRRQMIQQWCGYGVFWK